MRIAADEIPRGNILHQLGRQMRIEGRVIGFAITYNTAIGDQFDKQEVAPAGLWWRIGNHKSLDILDLHNVLRSFNSLARNRSGLGGKIQPSPGIEMKRLLGICRRPSL